MLLYVLASNFNISIPTHDMKASDEGVRISEILNVLNSKMKDAATNYRHWHLTVGVVSGIFVKGYGLSNTR